MQVSPFYSGRMAYDITGDNGEKYVYVPQEFVNRGFVQDGTQYFEPAFMQPGAFDRASSYTLSGLDGLTDAAKSLYSNPTQGYLWSAEDFAPLNTDDFLFTGYGISDTTPAITGLGSTGGRTVYVTNPSSGYEQSYMDPDVSSGVTFHNIKTTRSGGGGWLGSLGSSISNLISDLGPIGTFGLNFIAPGLGTGLAVGNALGHGNIGSALTSAALGELTGNSLFGATVDPASAITPEMLDLANATSDPIAALNAQANWTPSDLGYLAEIGASPEIIDQAWANMPAIEPDVPDASLPDVPDAPDVPEAPPEVPVEDRTWPESAGGAAGSAAGGASLANAALGGLAGAAAGSLLQAAFIPEIPTGGGGTQVPAKNYTPDWNMKFDPHTQYKDAPTFDFQFSDVPTDYFTQSQMTPGDQQVIGPGAGPYASQLVQALRGKAAGAASDNNGFTLFQTGAPA